MNPPLLAGAFFVGAVVMEFTILRQQNKAIREDMEKYVALSRETSRILVEAINRQDALMKSMDPEFFAWLADRREAMPEKRF